MELNLLKDFANEAHEEIGKYKFEVTLNPERLAVQKYPVENLEWNSVKYGDEEIERVPDDKRGVYAFAICYESSNLPRHGYILYIGIAGRNSNRSLRERYKDYLNQRNVMKRARIALMIGNWHSVLRFFYSPIADSVSSDELQELEKKLNGAFLPPFAVGDFDAEVREKIKAFR